MIFFLLYKGLFDFNKHENHLEIRNIFIHSEFKYNSDTRNRTEYRDFYCVPWNFIFKDIEDLGAEIWRIANKDPVCR